MVLIAVVASAEFGNTPAGKVSAAVLIAVTIALVEWLLIWTPKHFAAARRILDPRSKLVGEWLQDVRRVLHHRAEGTEPGENRFGVFWVEFQPPDDYCVRGFSYDVTGIEHSRGPLKELRSFAKDGDSMTYRWKGTIIGNFVGDDDPDRMGIGNLDLGSGTTRRPCPR
jgi:hypothetical protein